ncbi:hydantoinase/oxoprolinase family protein [Bacillus aerolatus]|uniref:Hydantoinase/oxoprolinase family protein n=1 Tax=Bacillus aerolatus TaxID=2653354 RepID=A0A6I1FIP0_9BACI|nr:hydantoinase/oxoprolinase family protein [Bacillus aerolatus]KAB7708270.1 hydantoinase/oxoprolinase family protein [Bacillus aerolatus]
MGYRICSDVGGTFTDVVVIEENGTTNIFKSLTTLENRVNGVVDCLRLAAEFYQKPLKKFMAECEFFAHGTTAGTNALIEGKVAKVGLLCTKGFRDVLLFREAGKDHPFDWHVDHPEPFVPRYLTLPVTERINSEGQISTPLNEDEVRAVIKKFKSYNVEAIAVSLLWSFVNPQHEIRIGEIIEEEWPEMTYTLSHQVSPRIREYRRTISTAIDASLKPLMNDYISHFENSLKEIGYNGELSLLTSSGGVLTPEAMMGKPIYSLDSGPALAPIAGKFYAEKEFNKCNVITCDMGGTSFDMSRITDGILTVTTDSIIYGEKINIPKVDVKTIGAGGGSIAWVDEGGLLRLGPEGAGSLPGPACYMRGGKYPTITDANLVLGYLDEGFFLGGTMKVSKRLAEQAIFEYVAKPLNVSIIEAAYMIYNSANHIMTEAMRDITIWEGIDPKEYTIVAGGGAIGMHVASIGSQLGCSEIIVPKTASTLSAFGGVVADVISGFSRSHVTTTDAFNFDKVNLILKDLEEEARTFLNRVGIPMERQVLEFSAEARYPFQNNELTVPLKGNVFINDDDITKFAKDFHNQHDETLGSKSEKEAIEIAMWKVKAKGIMPDIKLQEQNLFHEEPETLAIKPSRQAFFKECGGMIEVPVYNEELLRAGNIINGPAIIEQPTTNIVITPDCKATISRYGNVKVEIKAEKANHEAHKSQLLANSPL